MSAPLRVAVLSGGRLPDVTALAPVAELRSRGAEVSLISRQLPSSAQQGLFDAAHVLGRGPAADLTALIEAAADATDATDTDPTAPTTRQRPPLPQLVVRKAQLEARRARRVARRSALRARRGVQRRLRRTGPRPLGRDLRADPTAGALVNRADLVVALDRAGVRIAWDRARQTGAGAVLGLPAAIWWMDHR